MKKILLALALLVAPVYAGGPNPTSRVADGAITQYALVKPSTTAGRVTTWLHTDSVSLVTGIAATAGTLGNRLLVMEAQGVPISVISDGAAVISPGDQIQPSTTVDGEVTKGTTSPLCTATSAAAAVAGTVFACAGWHSPSSSGGSSSFPEKYYFSDVDYYAGRAPTIGSTGNFVNGVQFQITAGMHITGIRWYQMNSINNVTCELWDVTAGGAHLNTVTVTPTQNAVNTCTFATSTAITNNGHLYAISVYDGINQLLYDGVTSPEPFKFAGVSWIWTPHIIRINGCSGSTDVVCNSGSQNYAGAEPTYTLP